MLQITFLALGLSGLLFAIAYFFKKYQRGILWAAALILFIGTSLMLGLGLIKVVENGVANHLAVFSVILSFACSGIFACGAEKIHEASLKKASLSLSETQGKEPHEEATPEQELSKMEEIPNDNEDVHLPAKLDTPLARQVFQKALEVNDSGSRSFTFRQEGDIKRYMNGHSDKEEAAGTVYKASLPFLKVDECERMKGKLS